MGATGSSPAPPKKRRPGIYGCIGVDMTDHPRAAEAGAAMGTWAWGLLYSRQHEFDGFVPDSAIRLAWAGVRQARRDIATLVRVGLILRTEREGVLGHSWNRFATWNETKIEIEAQRAAWREKAVSRRKTSSGGALVSGESLETLPRVPTSTSLSDLGSDLGSDAGERARVPSQPPRQPTLLPPPPRFSLHPPSAAEVDPGGADVTAEVSGDLPGGVDASTPALSAPRPTGRAERPWGTRRLEQAFVVTAFEAGVLEATGIGYRVAKDELSPLDDAIDGHCPERTHTEERDGWIRRTAADFRRAIAGHEQWFKGGGSPRGLLEWLNRGRPPHAELWLKPEERQLEDRERTRKASSELRDRALLEVTRRAEAEALPAEAHAGAAAEALRALERL